MNNSLIYKKMSLVMSEVRGVEKNQKNVAQGFKFRGIDDMINAFYPALVRNGVFIAPRATSFIHELKDVVRGSGKAGVDKHVSIMMEYDFYAEDGSKVTVGPIPAEGLDSGDKATNKALSAALKYALIQTFSVPTEDMAEADLDSPEIGKTANYVSSNVVLTEATNLSLKDTATVNNVSQATTAVASMAKKSSFRKSAASTPVETKATGTDLSVEEWS